MPAPPVVSPHEPVADAPDQPVARAPRRRGIRWLAGGLVVLGLGLVVLSVLTGAGEISPARTLDFLLGEPTARADAQLHMVVTTLRLPRTLVAVMVGAALGVAGALLQAVTRNPLAETGLLGVNAGAALGVVAGLTFAGVQTGYGYLVWAFAGALLASAVVLLVAGAGRAVSPLRLVLAGAALGATFKGVTSYLLLSSQTSYDEYRFWVLGSLSGVSADMAVDMLPPIGAGLGIALVFARPLAALALGDDSARALGHRPGLTRVLAAVAVTLLVAASVALVGPISFLGLLAPHVARFVVGPRMAAQLALSALVGMIVLLAADILARVVVRPFEAPAAVLIALIGGPVLVLIARSHRMLTLRAPGSGAR